MCEGVPCFITSEGNLVANPHKYEQHVFMHVFMHALWLQSVLLNVTSQSTQMQQPKSKCRQTAGANGKVFGRLCVCQGC